MFWLSVLSTMKCLENPIIIFKSGNCACETSITICQCVQNAGGIRMESIGMDYRHGRLTGMCCPRRSGFRPANATGWLLESFWNGHRCQNQISQTMYNEGNARMRRFKIRLKCRCSNEFSYPCSADRVHSNKGRLVCAGCMRNGSSLVS